MDLAEIVFTISFTIIIIVIASIKIRELREKYKETKKGMKWIDSKDLVNSNKSFKNCPNCGMNKIVTPEFGLMPPMIGTPFCKNCDYKFEPKKARLLVNGFNMMSSKRFSKHVSEAVRARSQRQQKKVRA